ncbi:PREDICTED: islet cell autoantigen 1-like protein [Nanorana parkeri]|uniref:islet cell autoantigen 1-like protein n=1 Tax=Nanorana parkeri TaxID=125878 RepID=UPI000854DDCA|nr:PREDICTED: islet cell autoantigen 1-like protein [Nanorana parkeri]
MTAAFHCYSMNTSEKTWVEEDQSMVSRMQKKFWKTKQVLMKVTGKKEDEHLVASDAELDAKLEVFRSIQATGSELLKIIEKYQQALNALAQEENDFGLHLKVHAQQNSTQAGRMMKVTGNALCSTAGQRLALGTPLYRLEQEMSTFTGWAVSDTLLNVNQMEKARTEYRGALLWMKDVSQELDPDTYKQMEKFRKVQIQVRSSKSQFDKAKMDVCQKVDLLGASRCNLLSNSLASYQTTLVQFWKTTAHLMSEIQEEFQDLLPYTPSYLEPTKQQDSTDNTIKNEQEGETANNQEANAYNVNGNLFDFDAAEKAAFQEEPKHLLLDSTEAEDFDQEFSFLNLQAPLSPELSQEEQNLFGVSSSQETNPWAQQSDKLSGFLPSQLLDMGLQSVGVMSNWTMASSSGFKSDIVNSSIKNTPEQATHKNTDMATWLNMFADLDPLASHGASKHSEDELFRA